MQAFLKNYRQSPRKVRLVADLIRGKKVDRALAELTFLNKRAAHQMKKVLESAVANARNKEEGIENKDLIVKEIMVDKGFILKRWRARAFGRAAPIHKHTSRIQIKLGKVEPAAEKKEEKKVEKKKTVKKAEPKVEKEDIKKEVKK